MATLTIDIYEGDASMPVIGHVFYGSKRMIEAIVAAHMKTDRFFKAAMDGEKWGRTPLRIEERWEM